MEKGLAVFVHNAFKNYGKKEILSGLSMRVYPGTIYGLLGASGCGKTTLLSCIVGRKSLDRGNLWVMGGNPGTKGSGVPGPKVGYMPQEIALVGEFTVKDVIYYFGRILDMEDDAIEDRLRYLSKLLDLPPNDRYVKHCSGGQQRRVSFAAAMVHSPKLLILDEPTVGLDPVLRESIWKHLLEITEKDKTAVIITTHYIEEARQAKTIGLMRNGRLLAEDSPHQLLNAFHTDSLEEVFLSLCKKQEMGALNLNLEANANSTSSLEIADGSTIELYPTKKAHKRKQAEKMSPLALNRHRIKALLGKNWLQFSRNYAGIAFLLVFPIIQMLAFYLAIGDDVKDIKLATVNDEVCQNYTLNSTVFLNGDEDCEFHQLGCRFLDQLDDPMLNVIRYDSLSEAMEKARHGRMVGVLYVPGNFSESLRQRLLDGRWAEEHVLKHGEFKVWLDMSNRQIGTSVQSKLYDIYRNFQKGVFKECNYSSRFGDVPMHFNDPVYGREDDIYTVFMIPGMLLTVMFFMGKLLTSSIIISDRVEGIWDRSIVAGVTSLEIVLTHFMLQICLVFVQMIEAMVLSFVVYKTQYFGSIFTIAFITLLAGLCGMSYGFLVSIMCSSHIMANIIGAGSFYPIILLCGLMWPLQGMPYVLQYFAKCLPVTMAIESLRRVIERGWEITDLQVLNGIGVQLLWILFFSVMSVILLKNKR